MRPHPAGLWGLLVVDPNAAVTWENAHWYELNGAESLRLTAHTPTKKFMPLVLHITG